VSARNDAPFLARLWVQAEPYINRWPVRAIARSVAASFPAGAVVETLLDVANQLPGSSGRLFDLAFAGAGAVSLVLFVWWIGKRHGGFLGAIKLTAWSYAFEQSLVAAAYGTWVAAGMDGARPDTTLIGINAVLAVGLFIPSTIMLRKLDPD
jgi:hypothetical protein